MLYSSASVLLCALEWDASEHARLRVAVYGLPWAGMHLLGANHCAYEFDVE